MKKILGILVLNLMISGRKKLEKDYKLLEPTTGSALKIIRSTPQGGLNVNLTYLCSLRCKYIVRK